MIESTHVREYVITRTTMSLLYGEYDEIDVANLVDDVTHVYDTTHDERNIGTDADYTIWEVIQQVLLGMSNDQ
jgi:hypothetical protein